MLMVVVVLFAACWTPILVNNVLVAFKIIDYLNMGDLKPMRITFHLMSYANSCLNPFVYAFMSKNFCEGFKYAIYACVRGKRYIRKQISARSVTSSVRMHHRNFRRRVLFQRQSSESTMITQKSIGMLNYEVRTPKQEI